MVAGIETAKILSNMPEMRNLKMVSELQIRGGTEHHSKNFSQFTRKIYVATHH